MHRQRLADVVVEQAVIRIGQAAVGLEPGRFARSHDRRQARMLGNHEPAAERLVYQAYGGDGSEAVVVQTQHSYGATAEVLTQGLYPALESNGIGQLDEIGRPAGGERGGQ